MSKRLNFRFIGRKNQLRHQEGNKKLHNTSLYLLVFLGVLWAFENAFSDQCPGNLSHFRTFFYLKATITLILKTIIT